MKRSKTEPYQRSRHRAALQAWVVAATAVAAIGLPQATSATGRADVDRQMCGKDRDAMDDAQQVASFWINALLAADTEEAMALMRLPATVTNQNAVQNDLALLSDLVGQDGVYVEPVASQQRGHWAFSVWEMNVPDVSLTPVVEPIALYNPSADGMFDTSTDWQVVPQGVEHDPALKPLYNADHAALESWVAGL